MELVVFKTYGEPKWSIANGTFYVYALMKPVIKECEDDLLYSVSNCPHCAIAMFLLSVAVVLHETQM